MQYRIMIGWPGINEGGPLQIGTAQSDEEAQPPRNQTIYLRFRVVPANFAMDAIRLEPISPVPS